MKTQLKKKKLTNKLKFWYYKNIKGCDFEELQYLMEDNPTEEDIYAELFGDSIEEPKPVKVKTLKEFEEAKSRGEIYIDGSRINLRKEDIERKNLKNFGIEIKLKELHVPEIKQQSQNEEEDFFIHLEKSNLKGNMIIGDLSPIYVYGIPVYISYSEFTFDTSFKEKHSEFFLDHEAPTNLKNKYYYPRNVSVLEYRKEGSQSFAYYVRNKLTFSEYMENYEYLKGKYLGNFKIEPKEQLKIQFIEQFGLKEAEKIIEELSKTPDSFYATLKGIMEGKTTHLYNPYPAEKTLTTEEDIEQIRAIIKKKVGKI